MVGYDPTKDDPKVPMSVSLLSGSLGGIVTRAIVSPIDVIKIRLQLQADHIGVKPKYRGIRQTVGLISKEEGLTAFWKGHAPAQLLSITYGGVQFMTFEKLTEWSHQIVPHTRQDTVAHFTSHFICGALASAIASIVAQPVDVLRTRLAAQREPKIYKGMYSAVNAMFVKEGWHSFYRGLVPTLTQIVPYSGLQFGCYSFMQSVWRKCSLTEGSVEHLLCGASAGIISKGIVYPLDVIKKRLQVQGFGGATVSEVTHYKGFRHCIRTIKQTEGWWALYKGWNAAVLKSCATSGLVFCTYEFFRSYVDSKTT